MAHIKALVQLAGLQGLDAVFIHAYTDGRDTPPTSGIDFVKDLCDFLAAEGRGAIATVSGRYYAMDRDKRWDRVNLAYDALVRGQGLIAPDAVAAVRRSYDRGEADAFILPTGVGTDAAARAASRTGA
jgi:2,3-bisphosphoglycerate-independent phosphoglycerate mutase